MLPLLPANLPAHPKLCLSFFDILAYLYETFPGAVAALAPGDWAGLAGVLFQGLEFASAGPATTQVLLETTSALAGYRAQALLSGREAAGPAAGAPGNVPGAVPWAGPTLTPLGALACRLLCRLVLVERGADVVAVASSSLLPLLITEGAGFVEATRDELVKHVSEPELQVGIGAGDYFSTILENHLLAVKHTPCCSLSREYASCFRRNSLARHASSCCRIGRRAWITALKTGSRLCCSGLWRWGGRSSSGTEGGGNFVASHEKCRIARVVIYT